MKLKLLKSYNLQLCVNYEAILLGKEENRWSELI